MRTLVSTIVVVVTTLVAAVTATGLHNQVPSTAQEKIKFDNKLMYNHDDRIGECVSFDFSNITANNEFTLAVRPEDGDLAIDRETIIKSVYEPDDASGWFCVNFETNLNSFDFQYVWIKDDRTHAVLASDCSGEEPLAMYQSEAENAMCGQIPEPFRHPGFRFGDPNDDCTYVNFGNNNPDEGGSLSEFCRHSWGQQVCYEASPITKVNSLLGDDEAWTCVGFQPEQSGSNSFELWMNPPASNNAKAYLRENPGMSTCQDSNTPSSSKDVTPGEMCPTLPVTEEEHFTQGGDCHSFDFSVAIFPTASFRYCRDTNETQSKCLPADVKDIHKITNTSGDFVLYCTHFTWGQDEADTFLWLKDDGSNVQAATNSMGCEAVIDVPHEFENLQANRCPGLPSAVQTYIKFNDFDGNCRSFNFTGNPPAGGSTASRVLYSPFEYCQYGGLRDDGGAARACDLSATVETIQMVSDDWYCIKYSSDLVQDDNNHLWVNSDASKAVLSSDCDGKSLLDFRISDTLTPLGNADGMCHVLPAPLRKEHLFWSKENGTCASVNLTGPLYTQNQVNEYDNFVYCRGVGGRRHCTAPRYSEEEHNDARKSGM
eukprot:gb/GECG01001852.1/.p1 GENE.gb/GECG01001852.1/~~gb/GECG01001852.1/.p1  ORF type:complete len:599 (+),score=51.08 gb/GECG01001852.1/:1-1797(+)